MSTFTRPQLLLACVLACLLSSACALTPAAAQSGHRTTAAANATDPNAAVPETRYQPAYVPPVPAAATTTPGRTWQEHNRIVASQPGHDAHAGHGKPAPDPQAHDHAHHRTPAPAQPEHKEHH
jgi:hypothetical protein